MGKNATAKISGRPSKNRGNGSVRISRIFLSANVSTAVKKIATASRQTRPYSCTIIQKTEAKSSLAPAMTCELYVQ